MILLLLALLPARGWAVAAMMVLPPVAVQAGMVSMMPCHADATDPGHGSSPLLPDSHAGTGADPDLNDLSVPVPDPMHGCSSCDLCHTQLAASSCTLQTPVLPRSDAPAVLSAPDTGRVLAASLERPPRA